MVQLQVDLLVKDPVLGVTLVWPSVMSKLMMQEFTTVRHTTMSQCSHSDKAPYKNLPQSGSTWLHCCCCRRCWSITGAEGYTAQLYMFEGNMFLHIYNVNKQYDISTVKYWRKIWISLYLNENIAKENMEKQIQQKGDYARVMSNPVLLIIWGPLVLIHLPWCTHPTTHCSVLYLTVTQHTLPEDTGPVSFSIFLLWSLWRFCLLIWKPGLGYSPG